jgi:hypothetical protein
MRCVYGILKQKQLANQFTTKEIKMSKQTVFFGTLIGFGFLLGVISGSLFGTLI